MTKFMKYFAYFVMVGNAIMIPLSLAAGSFNWFQAFFNISICFLIATSLFISKIFD